jgi:hypothetical protein
MLQIRDCKKCGTPIQGYNAKRRSDTGKVRCRKCYNLAHKRLQREYTVKRILKEISGG